MNLTLKGHKIQATENKVLRKISALKKDEESEHFRILHNEELRDLYSSLCVVG